MVAADHEPAWQSRLSLTRGPTESCGHLFCVAGDRGSCGIGIALTARIGNGHRGNQEPQRKGERRIAMTSFLQPTVYAVTRRMIYDRSARIGILGLGYEGLRLALLFSRANFVVHGFDHDLTKVTTLETRRSYLHQISAKQISEARDRGFRASVDLSQLRETEVILTCLPACLDRDGKPNMTSIREITFAIASYLHAGHLVIFENAIYPGATEEIVVPILEGANGRHLRVSRGTGAPDELFVGFSIGRADLSTSAGDPRDELIILAGTDEFAANLITSLMQSPSWKDSVFIQTYDEGGGFYDHVPPMTEVNPDGIAPILGPNDFSGIDNFTLSGFRVPLLVISPFTKKNFVSHTPMDFTAALKLIETRFNLPPLTARDASMPDMTEFFDFTTNIGPWATPPTPPAQNLTLPCVQGVPIG